MAETEYQRNMRKTREAAERNAAYAGQSARYADEAVNAQLQANANASAAAERAESLARQHLAEQRAAVERQQKTQAKALRLQIEAISEQRAHNFAMWRQTGEGVAYLEWERSATGLISKIGERDTVWDLASKDIWTEADAELTELSRSRPASTRATPPPTPVIVPPKVPKAKGRLAFTSGLIHVSFIVSLFVWITLGGIGIATHIVTHFTTPTLAVLRSGPNQFSEFIYSFGWLIPTIGLLLTGVGFIARPKDQHAAFLKEQEEYKKVLEAQEEAPILRAALHQRLIKEAEDKWESSLKAGRIKKYGYDPISHPCDDWAEINVDEMVSELEAFIVGAHSTPPALGTYPSIKMPAVVAISAIPSLPHRHLAANFTD